MQIVHCMNDIYIYESEGFVSNLLPFGREYSSLHLSMNEEKGDTKKLSS